MPDKLRRRGQRIVKHYREETSIENVIRADYNAQRRNNWWWGNDRGVWPGIWMTLAKKYEMPIAAIKNIVRLGGVSDRPLPAPLTEDQIRERQTKRGEFLVARYNKRYEDEMSRLLRQQWTRSQTDWYVSHNMSNYKEWRHPQYKGWGIVDNGISITVWHDHKRDYDADNMDEAKYWVESHV